MDWDQTRTNLDHCPSCHAVDAMMAQTNFGYQASCQQCGVSGPRGASIADAANSWNDLPRSALQAADRQKLNHALTLVEKTLQPKRRRRRNDRANASPQQSLVND